MTNGMNLFQKLIEIRKTVQYLQKNKEGHQFKYVSSSQVLGNVKNKMDELGVFLFPTIAEKVLTTEKIPEKKYYKGELKEEKVSFHFIADAMIKYTWVNAENPQDILEQTIHCGGIDKGDPAKAVGKMMTYGEKYLLLKTFQIPTDDLDPDSFQDMMEWERNNQQQRNQRNQQIHPNQNQQGDYPPQANGVNMSQDEMENLRAKYIQGKGNDEGFVGWIESLVDQGHNYQNILATLNMMIQRKQNQMNHGNQMQGA